MTDAKDGWDRNAWIDAVWEDSQLNKSALLVAEALRRHAGSDAKCWPGQRRLASLTRQRRNTVRDALESLEKSGHIKRTWVSTGPGSGHYSYTLTPGQSGQGGQSGPPGQKSTAPGSKEAPPPGQKSATNTSNRIPPSNTSTTYSGERVRDSDTEAVIVRVERETGGGGSGRQLTDQQAVKLLEHAGGDVDIAVEAFVDVWSKYPNASTYKLIGYAKDRIRKAEKEEAEKRAKRRDDLPGLRSGQLDRKAINEWADSGSRVIREPEDE